MRNANHPTASPTALAALTVQLASGGPDMPEGCNIQLFPDGEFSARDGRPGLVENSQTEVWRMDADIAAALIAQVSARETPLFIDYEHHTLTAKDNGHKAIAAGWVESLTYVPGRGLFAQVDWTEAASQHIKAKEYRYISPLFGFDLKTGAVRFLINAALTNNPALDGTAAVAAALEITRMEDPMSKKEGQTALSEDLAERLRWMLNLPVTATAQDIIAELDKVKAQLGTADTGVSILAILQDKDAQLAALSAQVEKPDPAKFVPLAALAALTEENATLKGRVAELEQKTGTAALSAQIDTALKDGRVNKALEPWLRDLATSSPESAKAYLDKAAPIAALSGMQTGSTGVTPTPPGAGSGVAALSAEDKEAARLLGISEEDFAKAKENK